VGHFVAYAPVWMGGGPPRPLESARADPGRRRKRGPHLDYGSARCPGSRGGRFVNAPLEERALEARFGEAYLEYKNKVPRWLGKTRR